MPRPVHFRRILRRRNLLTGSAQFFAEVSPTQRRHHKATELQPITCHPKTHPRLPSRLNAHNSPHLTSHPATHTSRPRAPSTTNRPPPHVDQTMSRRPLSPLRAFRLALIPLKCAALYHVTAHYLYNITPAEGASMLPTLDIMGEWVVVSSRHRHGRGVQVGDLVTYDIPVSGEWCGLKRVVGLPGDYVALQAPGTARGVRDDMIQVRLPLIPVIFFTSPHPLHFLLSSLLLSTSLPSTPNPPCSSAPPSSSPERPYPSVQVEPKSSHARRSPKATAG